MKVIQQIETRAMRIYKKSITRAGVPDCTEARFFAGAAVCVGIFYTLMAIAWAIETAKITALVPGFFAALGCYFLLNPHS